MKNLILIVGTMAMISFSQEKNHKAGPAVAPETEEKENLLNYYEDTFKDLKNEISGLSEAQLQYKPSAEEWSISQILEHIVLTEKMIFDATREQMNQPPNPERKAEVKISDEELLAGMVDRSQKVKSSEELEGEGKYSTPEAAMEEFAAHRQVILDFIESIPVEEFRNRINDSPFGPVDAYQSMLFIAGHTARHALQIEEVKTSDGFPSE